ncbi:acyl carrier protein [Actinomadura algeriensis]|uniref:Acyl carrier protein n=1 Tax=Actinomadura algeriensis TaxID=1679523 RepID=A0ABR9JJU7_9ACTN|nr:acyl carrier protein [Actinomadura algeriensis]MBE1530415.1 acyl carrier protein [Actinomadura algeriensis]
MNTAGNDIDSMVAGIVEEVAGAPRDEVTPDKHLMQDLDVDSLGVVEIGAAIFDRFEVEIDDDEIKDIRTVGDVTELIRRHLTARAAAS